MMVSSGESRALEFVGYSLGFGIRETYGPFFPRRSTRPKALLNMAATLCLDAISGCAQGKIDADVLNNGISYFLGPLLNWTLVGIIKAILKEVKLTT